jgi:hypothetical protein
MLSEGGGLAAPTTEIPAQASGCLQRRSTPCCARTAWPCRITGSWPTSLRTSGCIPTRPVWSGWTTTRGDTMTEPSHSGSPRDGCSTDSGPGHSSSSTTSRSSRTSASSPSCSRASSRCTSTRTPVVDGSHRRGSVVTRLAPPNPFRVTALEVDDAGRAVYRTELADIPARPDHRGVMHWPVPAGAGGYP